MTIRRRLTLGYISIAVLIGWSGLTTWRLGDRLEDQGRAQAREAAARTVRSIDQALFHRFEHLRAQARETGLARAARESGEAFDVLPNLEVRMEQIDEDWKLGRETPEIREVFDSEMSETLRGLTEFFEEEYGFSLFPEIFVTNKHGVIIGVSGQPSDYLQSDEIWYTEALVRDFWIGEVTQQVARQSSRDLYTLEFAVRLIDADGDFAGVLKATLNLQEVLEILRTSIPSGGERPAASFLISADDQVIFALDRNGDHLLDDGARPHFGAVDVPMISADDPSADPSEAEEFFGPEIDPARIFAVRAESPGFRSFSGLGWTSVLLLDVEGSIGGARTSRYVAAAIHAAALLLTIFVGFWIARSVARPLLGLEEATRAIVGGRLETRIQISSDDEIGLLAAGFNEMLEELHDAHLDLRRRERLATLGELSGSVAHEIRNPLGVIKNSIYVLRHRLNARDVTGHRQLDRIEKQVAAANRIISELLDFTGDPARIVERLELQKVCGRALAELEVPEMVDTIERLDGEPLEVVADPHQVGRILDNLLRNAVQAMPDGGMLSVICERRGPWAVVSVRDSGVGISPADLERVFEPLFTRKAKGIGLGLALSQRYARINGGRIECESVPGRGTMFRLFLPLVAGIEA